MGLVPFYNFCSIVRTSICFGIFSCSFSIVRSTRNFVKPEGPFFGRGHLSRATRLAVSKPAVGANSSQSGSEPTIVTPGHRLRCDIQNLVRIEMFCKKNCVVPLLCKEELLSCNKTIENQTGLLLKPKKGISCNFVAELQLKSSSLNPRAGAWSNSWICRVGDCFREDPADKCPKPLHN